MNRKLPNFLVVGAAKSGTTSMFYYMNQHHDIYIPSIKECRFFSQMPRNQVGLGAERFQNGGIRSIDDYCALFSGRTEKRLGDISNDYLYYYEESIKNIKRFLGNNVKIIIILRNPIERAYSNYLHALREGWENATFEEALIKEIYRIRHGWSWVYHYVRVGFYYKQVKAYMEQFPDLRVWLYEDLFNINLFLKKIFEFLEVDSDVYINTEKRYNISGYPKSRLLHDFLTKRSSLKSLSKSVLEKIVSHKVVNNWVTKLKHYNLERRDLNEETREYLKFVYREDINALAKLIGRDLSSWIE